MSSEKRIIKAMRNMAWEHAKGEMEALFQLYYSEGNEEEYKRYTAFVNEWINFKSKVANEGWLDG